MARPCWGTSVFRTEMCPCFSVAWLPHNALFQIPWSRGCSGLVSESPAQRAVLPSEVMEHVEGRGPAVLQNLIAPLCPVFWSWCWWVWEERTGPTSRCRCLTAHRSLCSGKEGKWSRSDSFSGVSSPALFLYREPLLMIRDPSWWQERTGRASPS